PLLSPPFPYTTLFRSHRARRPDTGARRRLEHFAHFRLLQQRHVARDLAGGGDDLTDAVEEIVPHVAMHVPRWNIGEPEMHRQAIDRKSTRLNSSLLGI